jgi:phosphomannomutase
LENPRFVVDPRVFRTYDIRALVPDLVGADSVYFGKLDDPEAFNAPLTTDGVETIGRGLALLMKSPVVAIGRDSRLSGPQWVDSLSHGFNAQGVDVIDLGLTTTDMVYYISGARGIPAVQVTASHCSRELNGMKMVRGGARVIGRGSGMDELREIVLQGSFPAVAKTGIRKSEDILPGYIEHLLDFVDQSRLRSLRVIGDAGNGVGGIVARALAERIPQLSLEPMYFEPDGRFPNHEANPFEVENISELIARVPAEGADFGVAWDGDADRVYFVDETGEYIPGDFITALAARYFLERNPGEAVVYDVRSSWAVKEWILKLGGRPVPERVGHSYIKQTMRRENAVFGGEVSGHYYFRDHYFADNGFIPLLAVMTLLSDSGDTLSELVAGLGSYYVSGEINSTVKDTNAVMRRIEKRYANATLDFTDGISVDYPDWHFNVRPSANDPVVRLNLEAVSREVLELKTAEVLALIRS